MSARISLDYLPTPRVHYHVPMPEQMLAYSLGYEGISLERYVEMLKAHGIAAVVDVREHAWSYKKGFSKRPLQERLTSEGIGYVHIKSAGNPSRNRKAGLASDQVIARYREHLDSDPSCLDEVLAEVRRYAAEGGVCLLCFERKPHDCHRKVILDRLADYDSTLLSLHLAEESV